MLTWGFDQLGTMPTIYNYSYYPEHKMCIRDRAKRDDENFFYVGCWEYQGNDTTAPVLNKEPLEYEAIKAVSYTHLDVYKRQIIRSFHRLDVVFSIVLS